MSDNDKALRKIMAMLKEGQSFGFVYNYRPDHPCRPDVKEGFWPVMYAHWCKPYIYWSNFGSSAEKCTLKDLNWIIQKIFKMTPKEFLKSYTTTEIANKLIARQMTKTQYKTMPRAAIHHWTY